MMAEVSADGGKRGGGSKELVLADGCCERAAAQARCFHIQEFLVAKDFTKPAIGKNCQSMICNFAKSISQNLQRIAKQNIC